MEMVTLECVRELVLSMQTDFGEDVIPGAVLNDEQELQYLRENLERVGATDPFFNVDHRRLAEDVVFDYLKEVE